MKPLSLGGYPAKQCARRTHNEYAPGVPAPLPIPPDLQARFDAGLVFETGIVEEIRQCYGAAPDLLVLCDDDWAANQDRTRAAMSAGVPVIVNGRLPDVNGRVGAPDLLIGHLDGYLPVDIKNHQTLKPATNPDSPKSPAEVIASSLRAPDNHRSCPGYSNRGSSWRADVMQLAHYTRMLQELGHHPGVNLGGIIGTSDFTPLTGDGHGIAWYDLDVEDIKTYSASSPNHKANRSALQHYDHEFEFRTKVAQAARAGDELVRPYHVSECAECAWLAYCTEVAGPDDASFHTETGLLTARQWKYLYDNCGHGGALSVAELAGIDLAGHTAGFSEQSVGTPQPATRLANTVRRAAMTIGGISFEPQGPTPPQVPCADIEVDFDIEWDADRRIYQYGVRVRHGQDDTTARYEPIVSFAPLDEQAEQDLAEQFADRIRQLRTQARQEAKALRIFHWHHPEISMTRKFPVITEAIDGLTLDLRAWFDANYFARTSSSLKAIAPIFGFRWAVIDAGGAASMRMIETARGTGPDADEARQWCLRYNECDVTAQAVIRDALRNIPTGPGQAGQDG